MHVSLIRSICFVIYVYVRVYGAVAHFISNTLPISIIPVRITEAIYRLVDL